MERIINIDKKHALNGSFTVEMSLADADDIISCYGVRPGMFLLS